jgi:hypothetical protein
MRNVSFALRMLLKTPFVTSVAVATRARGIGANNPNFSILDHILLHNQPLRAPGEQVNHRKPGPLQGQYTGKQARDGTVILT